MLALDVSLVSPVPYVIVIVPVFLLREKCDQELLALAWHSTVCLAGDRVLDQRRARDCLPVRALDGQRLCDRPQIEHVFLSYLAAMEEVLGVQPALLVHFQLLELLLSLLCLLLNSFHLVPLQLDYAPFHPQLVLDVSEDLNYQGASL